MSTGASKQRTHHVLVRMLCYLGLACINVSCTYLDNVTKQSKYSRIHETNPSQHNLKHMIDRQTFLVYGQITDKAKAYAGLSFAVVAYSNRYIDHELVDATDVAHSGTHYGLNLPSGVYDLLVLADQDRNGSLNQSEVVGRHQIELTAEAYPEKVAHNIDLELSALEVVDWVIDIPVPQITPSQESLFYPKGAIRALDDPLFDADIADLGMYEPAAFLEKAPTMFYALEEDSYRTPVVFVHGMGGSAREFAAIVDRLDQQRYKPWFFYYPSGRDLDQLAEIFYDIYLSGKVVSLDSMPLIIVAHSMGGLVVREALNKYRGNKRENQVALLITIASPLGGHPAAATGEKRGPLVLPAWRDLNPASSFINRLFRKPLPSHVKHQLLYTYGNPGKLNRGENSDGVVPLSSQLIPVAQRQASVQFGFNSSHAGVLKDKDTIRHVVTAISQVKSPFPESHIKVLMRGGYDVDFNDSYSEKDKHYIRTMGKYLYAVAGGKLEYSGSPSLERFVEVAQGKASARTDVETAWSKFIEDYPRYRK